LKRLFNNVEVTSSSVFALPALVSVIVTVYSTGQAGSLGWYSGDCSREVKAVPIVYDFEEVIGVIEILVQVGRVQSEIHKGILRKSEAVREEAGREEADPPRV
jgi:hypothetical protein